VLKQRNAKERIHNAQNNCTSNLVSRHASCKLIKGKKSNLADTSGKKMFRIRVFGTDYLSLSATSYLSCFIMTNPPVREENS